MSTKTADTKATKQSGYYEKFVGKAWVPFNKIKVTHPNWSRPNVTGIENESKDKQVYKSFLKSGYNAAFPAALEKSGNDLLLHGGFRRYEQFAKLVGEGKIAADSKWYADIYEGLTDQEREDLNYDHNYAQEGKADPGTVQKFIATAAAWDKPKARIVNGNIVHEKPADGATALERCMGYSYGVALGFHPLLAINKLRPNLEILERAKNSLKNPAPADSIWLVKAQKVAPEMRKLLDLYIKVRSEKTGEEREKELVAVDKLFNAAWVPTAGNAAKQMSKEDIKSKIAGSDNELVQLTGQAVQGNDTTALDLFTDDKDFNVIVGICMKLKKKDMQDAANMLIDEFLPEMREGAHAKRSTAKKS